MEIPLLTPFREEDFGHDLQQMSSFLAVTWINLNQRPNWKLTYCWWEQVGIKASEVLKLVKLILLVPTTNAVNERQCWAWYWVKTYLWSFVTQGHWSSCLVTASLKEKVHKRKLVEVAKQFRFENEHSFSIFGQILTLEVYWKCC